MKRLLAASLLMFASALAAAELSIEAPWVAATEPQQKSTGAFMRLTSPADARLIGVRSPAASVVEIHEMRMENEVMKMRRLRGLDLPSGRAVEIKPGGYHIMLIALKRQLKEGESVPIILVLEDKGGKRSVVETTAVVRAVRHHHGGAHK